MSHPATLSPTQQVFERVIARPVAEPDVQHGRLVHVAWRSSEQAGRVVQFYINGAFALVSDSPADREAWLLLDAQAHQQIELLAVDPADAYMPMQEHLAGIEPPVAPRASTHVLRDQALPIDATLGASVDSHPAVTTPLFQRDTPRGGFGAVFGEGGFGFDASVGPGLGRGQLGYGPLGSDGDALVWTDDTLAPGPHTLELSLHDSAGERAALPLDDSFTISRLPDPPGEVALSPDLLLTWT